MNEHEAYKFNLKKLNYFVYSDPEKKNIAK